MRKHHQRFIDIVNDNTPVFDEKIGHNEWRTLVPITFYTPDGDYVVPPGVTYDRFSCVSNTDYEEFSKASLLHDIARLDPEVPRQVADFWFYDDMVYRIEVIRSKLLRAGCEKAVVDREVIRLSRIASIYMIGVSGRIGTLYLWLDKIF